MRNAFLSLLLINLLIPAWYGWIATPGNPPPVPRADTLPLLQSDSPGASPPAAAASTDDASASSMPPEQRADTNTRDRACFRVGPWSDEAAAQQVEELLANRGMSARPIARETQIWLGHWVQIGGFGTTEAAEEARLRLAAGGMADALLLQDGAQALISLGVFRDRGRAERVVSEARGLGFSASVRDRFRPGVERWLLVQPPPGQTIQPEDLRLSEALILRAEPTPCDSSLPSGNAPDTADRA